MLVFSSISFLCPPESPDASSKKLFADGVGTNNKNERHYRIEETKSGCKREVCLPKTDSIDISLYYVFLFNLTQFLGAA